MSLFWILAIGLTVLYVIYYPVVIMHDLYGKKETEKSSEEDIDVPESDTAEKPISIDEVDDDSLFEGEKDGEVTLIDGIDEVGEVVRQEAMRHSADEECKRITSVLNEIQVSSTGATEKEEFVDMLVNQPAGGCKIFLIRDKV